MEGEDEIVGAVQTGKRVRLHIYMYDVRERTRRHDEDGDDEY